MKPAPFDYAAPETVEEAVALLGEHGDDAKVLAGGQSLVPLLAFRLARPALLVDVNRVDELAFVRRRAGRLHVGALTRAATLERSQLVARGFPLVREAMRLAGHPQIRSRGTVGGSVAHADPSAELPTILTALDARIHVRSARGTRTLAPAELFVGYLTTALEPDELVVEIELPDLPPRTGTAFEEYARVHGDFALAGAAVTVTSSNGSIGRAAIALLGAGPTPLRASEAERALVEGSSAVDAASAVEVESADPHRRALVRELLRRAIERAREAA